MIRYDITIDPLGHQTASPNSFPPTSTPDWIRPVTLTVTPVATLATVATVATLSGIFLVLQLQNGFLEPSLT